MEAVRAQSRLAGDTVATTTVASISCCRSNSRWHGKARASGQKAGKTLISALANSQKVFKQSSLDDLNYKESDIELLIQERKRLSKQEIEG